MKKIFKTALCAVSLSLAIEAAHACTRVVYLGEDTIMTARSMDWKSDVDSNIWIFPRNVERTGMAGPTSVKWTSKYGSVITSGYDITTTDGINEKGLAANLLWLVESEYPDPYTSKKPLLSISLWAQYMLDNFETVADAVKYLEQEPFTVVTDEVPGENRLATLHLSLSDASGDSAIVEYIGGKQVIHHSRKYQVMTNSPSFDQQLALNTYWQQIGGTVMLPGTNRASDRFARASFYINAIPQSGPHKDTLASVFSVIRNASVPFGINTEAEPNISSTRWRTVTDHTNGLYFFESALSPNLFWVDVKDIDFGNGKTMKLDLGPDQSIIYSGKANASFKEAKPFTFLGIK